MFIYKTTNLINNKIYIGQSMHELGHWRVKNYFGSGKLIIKAIKKYGKENFKRETLIICENYEQLNRWEFIFIKKYNSCDKSIGYNILSGPTKGINHRSQWSIPELREQMLKNIRKGENHPCFNTKHTQEFKDQVSKKLKGRSSPMKGRKQSQKFIDCVKKRKGENHPIFDKNHTEESKKKMSESAKGRILSEETKKKFSLAKLGIKMNEDQRKALSARITGVNNPNSRENRERRRLEAIEKERMEESLK